jgi:hypothetical protein
VTLCTEELKLQNLSSEDLLIANPNHAVIPADSSDEGPPDSDDAEEDGKPESDKRDEQKES